MEQSTSSSSFLSTLFTGYEIEIAEVLLHLPNLIQKPNSPYPFSVNWVSKRRRSAIKSSPYQSPSVRLKTENSDIITPRRIKAEASSPTTPLSFSPSESDAKSKDSVKKVSKKRTREEWIGIIDGLILQRESLRGEIDTEKSYFNKLQAVNRELKAKRKELQCYLGTPLLEKSLNHGMKLNQPIKQSPFIKHQDPPQIHSMIHQQPFILDQTAYRSSSSQPCQNLQYPHGQMPQIQVKGKSTMRPLGIPDLNEAAEETFGMDAPQPLDHLRALAESRAKAAEARRRRMVRIKEMKNSLATIKPQQHFAFISI